MDRQVFGADQAEEIWVRFSIFLISMSMSSDMSWNKQLYGLNIM